MTKASKEKADAVGSHSSRSLVRSPVCARPRAQQAAKSGACESFHPLVGRTLLRPGTVALRRMKVV